jgi:hypothetical protein
MALSMASPSVVLRKARAEPDAFTGAGAAFAVNSDADLGDIANAPLLLRAVVLGHVHEVAVGFLPLDQLALPSAEAEYPVGLCDGVPALDVGQRLPALRAALDVLWVQPVGEKLLLLA